jgi:hypothetical protein
MEMSDQPPGPDVLRELAESLWEELGGDLCICQRPDVPHWCEKCQGRIDLIAARVREAAALSGASSPSGGDVSMQLLAWAVTNCHMLARRALARSTSMYDREKWEHVLRICDKAGARSAGVLRASVPTEITDGAAESTTGSGDSKMSDEKPCCWCYGHGDGLGCGNCGKPSVLGQRVAELLSALRDVVALGTDPVIRKMCENAIAKAAPQVLEVTGGSRTSPIGPDDDREQPVQQAQEELTLERLEVIRAIARKEAAMRSEFIQRERAEAAEAALQQAQRERDAAHAHACENSLEERDLRAALQQMERERLKANG